MHRLLRHTSPPRCRVSGFSRLVGQAPALAPDAPRGESIVDFVIRKKPLGYAGRFDPVTVVEERLVRAMRQRKHLLVDRFPRLVAESLRLRVVGVEHVSSLHHRTSRQPVDAVFGCKLLVERCLEDCGFYLLHLLSFSISGSARWRGEGSSTWPLRPCRGSGSRFRFQAVRRRSSRQGY